MTNQHEAHLLSGAYALHAVTRDEAALVEAAMAESEELHGEVIGLIDTAVTLGLAVPRTAPPAAMRARLLEAIGSLPQEPASSDSVDGDAAGGDLGRGDPGLRALVNGVPDRTRPDAVLDGRHLASRRRRRMRRPVVLLASAAAALALFSGALAVQRAAMQPQADYDRIVAAADHEQATARVSGGGTVKVLWSDSARHTAVSLSGVHVPAGKALQVWSIRGGTTVSDGLYPGGDAAHKVIDGAPAAGEQLAVSIEPAAGSRQPTTRPIVQLPLGA